MAPEIFSSEKTQLPYGTKSDLFSLGVIAHLMFEGENPLKGKGKKEYDRTCSVNMDCAKLKEKWGCSGESMISGLMNETCNKRWDAQRLLSCQFLNTVEQ